ncbi:GNAT family N-acetyltransferase [Tumebacillus sp. DT12]|uniref:GNAT family N-acetyltransferase n=1 Tax=Tumebacillus lacus TaxID=2995335 RepID=A0ABT3X454_9BACL|nr:GNAT family N-acetyltransferase [Tumebacillus lacus]MCX7571681.1 GNAT family N-acetyltransferase [Tumebacillus lacus]
MRGLHFREATLRDVPAMAPLFTKRPQKEREKRMRERYHADPDGWYVALSGGEVVGCCQAVFPRKGEAWLQWMRIAPRRQGAGIGTRFTAYVEEQAMSRGAEVIRLNTRLGNERVRKMMQSLGFTARVRWTRWSGLRRDGASRLVRLVDDVYLTDDAETVQRWLRPQDGHLASHGTVTCPDDFRKTVSLDLPLLEELAEHEGRSKGVVVAEQDEEVAGIALYAVHQGELRVLQLVAATTDAGVAAAAGAVRMARPGERVTIQLAGADRELTDALRANFRTGHSREHSFYVFGKEV